MSYADLSGAEMRNAKWVEACGSFINGPPGGITLKACPQGTGR
jgi:hypothetical protein